MLESLPIEQQPIAQQLLRGGIPAVRTALHFERERAREAGRPEPSTEGVLALAESLVSRVKAAEWRDRAEAAIKAGDDLAMRDLRALVSGSDAARDEASRDLVVTLRELLEHRIEAHRTTWANDVTKNLDEGHVVRALRLSSRPPDPAARFSAELATRLRDAASAALSPATPEGQWLAVLQAVVESPVRRTVRPEGLPANPSPELLETARQHCGRVPALAPLLGISVPPPPGPVRPNVPPRGPARGHGRPIRPPGRPVRRTATAATPSVGPAAGTESRSEASPAADGEPTGEVQPVAPGEEVAGRSQEAPEAVAQPDAVEDEPVVDEPVVDEPVVDDAVLDQAVVDTAAEPEPTDGEGAAPGLPEPVLDAGAQVEQATDGEALPPTPPAEANEVQAAVVPEPEQAVPEQAVPEQAVVVPSMDTEEPSAGEPPETGEQLETGEPPQAEAEPQVPGTGVTSAAGALRASEP